METLYQGPQPQGHHQDLKVTILESILLFSPQESEKKSMFLSNIDQVLNFDVQTIHFFESNPNFPPKIAVNMVKNALEKMLVPYYFLAGRIKVNNGSGRIEIDCNNGGIGFVEASSEYKLDELGDLVYPNPFFEQLVTKKMSDALKVDGHPLCIVQMTCLKCGGFAMALQTNHAIFDGTSFKYFLQNLAAVASEKPLAIIPCNEREMLAARSPPRVTFPHPELLELKIPIGQEGESEQNPNVYNNSSNDLDFKIFSLSQNDIFNLKVKAKDNNNNNSELMSNGDVKKGGKITGFNVISALIWRCKALSGAGAEDNNNYNYNKDRSSTMLFSVDIRPRLNPPLPSSYTGNAVLISYATATYKELEEGPLSRLVELVSEGASRMNDEYARSAIDWGELYKGFPHGEFLITSWWRLGFNLVDYPWGRPKYSCPLVYHRKDIILLFPDIDDSKAAVNVLVTLPHKEMAKFQALFQTFLSA